MRNHQRSTREMAAKTVSYLEQCGALNIKFRAWLTRTGGLFALWNKWRVMEGYAESPPKTDTFPWP